MLTLALRDGLTTGQLFREGLEALTQRRHAEALIDGLAEAGAGFTNAISPVPLTLPAHASLLTGMLGMIASSLSPA